VFWEVKLPLESSVRVAVSGYNIKNLKNLYLIHGEEDKMKVFTKKIKEELNIDAKIVKYAQAVEL